MKFGISLAAANPSRWAEITREGDRLGFDSVWIPEHLVLTMDMSSSPFEGEEHPPVPPTIPVFDAFVFLGFLAGQTERIRFGTYVYNLGLRHPFVSARAVQTLDVVSGGRADVGIGASWLRQEWEAAGLDFRTRGRRVDEALAVCKRLWSEEVVEHHGEFFDFPPVAFEPKPVQQPWPPVHVGGESDAALRRAASAGDGWIGMRHTLESVAGPIARLRALRAEAGREGDRIEVTVAGPIETPDDVARWEEAGVDRLMVSPWTSTRDAVEGLRRFAGTMFG